MSVDLVSVPLGAYIVGLSSPEHCILQAIDPNFRIGGI